MTLTFRVKIPAEQRVGRDRLPAERAKNGRGRVGACRRVLIDIRDLDALTIRSKKESSR
jgi:hypothetical protein